MDDPWTSCRSILRPRHDISWTFQKEDNNQYYYNMEEDHGSIDSTEGGHLDPSSDILSFQDMFIEPPAAASLDLPGFDPPGATTLKALPQKSDSDKKRSRDDDQSDPFFPGVFGQDSFELHSPARMGDHDTLSSQADTLSSEDGKKRARAGSYEADDNPVRRPRVASLMHRQDTELAYHDHRGDNFPPLLSPWVHGHNLQLAPSFQAHHPFPLHASYPGPYPHAAHLFPGEFDRQDQHMDRPPVGRVYTRGEYSYDAELMSAVASTPRAQEALKTWYERLGELREYFAEYGDTNVPQKYPANQKLGVWVNKQRMEKKAFDDGKATSMSTEKLHALNELGFVWAKRKGQHSWDTKYAELKAYMKENGDCHVPTKYEINPALGRWVSTQRSQYKAWKSGEKTNMTEEKFRKLQTLGFIWSMIP